MSPSAMMTDIDDDMQDIIFAKKGCCFWIPCSRTNSKMTSSSSSGMEWSESMQSLENKKWWRVRAWSKVREGSELVGGPKWKTFIRGSHKNCATGYIKQGPFQYDPFSYALNFDDGTGEKGDEDYAHDFSFRYASLPTSAKSSMDLGKDGPSFT